MDGDGSSPRSTRVAVAVARCGFARRSNGMGVVGGGHAQRVPRRGIGHISACRGPPRAAARADVPPPFPPLAMITVGSRRNTQLSCDMLGAARCLQPVAYPAGAAMGGDGVGAPSPEG